MKHINKRICFMPSDGGSSDDRGDGQESNSDGSYGGGSSSDGGGGYNAPSSNRPGMGGNTPSIGSNTPGIGSNTSSSVNNQGRQPSPIGLPKEVTIDLDRSKNPNDITSDLSQQARERIEADKSWLDKAIEEYHNPSFNTQKAHAEYVDRIFGTNYASKYVDLSGRRIAGLADYDTKMSIATQVGFVDDLTVNVLDFLGIDPTELNIDIAQDVMGLVVGLVLGAPALGMGLATLGTTANVMEATGAMSHEQNQAIQMGIAMAKFGIGMMGFMQSVSAAAQYGSMMTNTGKLAITAVVATQAYQMYGQAQALNEMAREAGMDVSDISQSDLIGFDTAMQGEGEGSNGLSVEQSYEKLLSWKVLNDITMGKGSPLDASDVFDKMAGGILYSHFFGGGMYFHPLGQQEQNLAAVGSDTVFNNEEKQLIMQEELAFIQNTSSARGNTDPKSKSAISTAKASLYNRIQRGQEEINVLINEYNANIKAGQYEKLDSLAVTIDEKNKDMIELAERM